MVQRHEICQLLETFEYMENDGIKFQLGNLITNAITEFVGQCQAGQPILTAEEIGHLKDGRRIPAIKSVRERLGLKLRDAIEYVNKHMGPYYNPNAEPKETKSF